MKIRKHNNVIKAVLENNNIQGVYCNERENYDLKSIFIDYQYSDYLHHLLD